MSLINIVILGSGAPGTPGVNPGSRHMQQLLLVTSCDSPAGIGASLRTDAQREGRTDVEVEIVI